MSKSKTKNAFLIKLREILDQNEYNKYICWDKENPYNIIILNKEKFSENVLLNHFKHDKFSSFVRQLNMYDFKKVKAKNKKKIYHNNKFYKGISDEEIELIPKKQKKQKIQKLNDDENKENNLTIPKLENQDNIDNIINKDKINDNELKESLVYLLNDMKKLKEFQKILENKIEKLVKEKKDKNKKDSNYKNKKEKEKNNNLSLFYDNNNFNNSNNNLNIFDHNEIKQSILSDNQNFNNQNVSYAKNLKNKFNRSCIIINDS